MAEVALQNYIDLIPVVKKSPHQYLWSSYDAEADVMYINFKKPSHATDSELTDDDVIIRYEGDEVVGLTILHVSKRKQGLASISKAQLDLPSEEELAFKFSELMSSKARAKGPVARKEADQAADEALQKDLEYLSEQQRKQEVSSRIAGLKTCCASDAGAKIIGRLKALRSMLKEEEGPEADISPESLKVQHRDTEDAEKKESIAQQGALISLPPISAVKKNKS